MRIPLIFGAIAMTAWTGVRADDGADFAPEAFAVDRYTHIWDRSPFVIETKIVSESAGLAERFALTGIAIINGNAVISLLDRSTQTRVMVAADRPAQGIEVISVEQQSDPRNSSATIKLGAEQASLKFEAASLTRVTEGAPQPAGVPGATAASRPDLVPQVGQPIAPVAANGQPPPPPAATRVIRRTLIKTRE